VNLLLAAAVSLSLTASPPPTDVTTRRRDRPGYSSGIFWTTAKTEITRSL
jgi:hypothetical protein